jgi:hypothetical protein
MHRLRHLSLLPCRLSLLLTLTLGAACSAALAAGEPYFQDDFSASGGRKPFFEGTLEQRHFTYQDGQYEIDTRDGSTYGQSVLVERLGSFRVETTGQLVESKDPTGGGFGLTFNYRERHDEAGSDFMLFLVYNRGAFTVLRYLDGKTTVLLTPTKTRLFQPGEAVTLMVESAAGQLTFFINGAEAARLTETTLTDGGMGMFCTAGSVARFDEFKIFSDKAAAPPPQSTGFSDDFASDKLLYSGEWGEVKYSYLSGRYVIDTSGTSYIGLSPYPDPAQDFEFSADVELLDGDPQGGFGLYLRDWPNDSGAYNQFRFLISGDWFAIEQSVDDRPLALAEWTQHAAVQPGVNRLKVRAEGKQLTFWINGEQVYSCSDDKPHSGNFGLFASAGLRVAFDNVEFKEL